MIQNYTYNLVQNIEINLHFQKILSAAFLVTAGSLVCLATTLLAQQHGWAAPAWLPAAAMVLSLASGVSPVPYIIMSEMFHFQVGNCFSH